MNIFRSWLYISHFGFKAVLCICTINYAEDQFDWFLYCGKESCGKESFEAVTLRVRRQGQSLFLVKSIYSNIAVSTDGFSCAVATLRLFLSSASDWCVGRRLFSTCEIFFNKNPWGLRNQFFTVPSTRECAQLINLFKIFQNVVSHYKKLQTVMEKLAPALRENSVVVSPGVEITGQIGTCKSVAVEATLSTILCDDKSKLFLYQLQVIEED